MQIDTFYPKSLLLKKHIEYYYFLKSDSSSFNETYYAFPNIRQGLNIHRNAECEIKPHFTGVYENPQNKFLTIVQGYFSLPLLVDLRGKLDKVTIIFKPLGLNHFINNPIKEIVGQPSSIFAEWDGDKYAGFLNAFYRTNVNRKRIVLLEEFLLSRYKTFAEATVLKEVLNHLTDFENERSVEEIARVVNLNVRTLNRLFGKHLGISPITFRKIARFRHAMKNRIYGERLKTLTEIGYESNFYDQSYFIKMYQKLTGNNPSKFFRSIEKLSDDRLVFSFIKK
jgi:AraC-like DNA-binding protein